MSTQNEPSKKDKKGIEGPYKITKKDIENLTKKLNDIGFEKGDGSSNSYFGKIKQPKKSDDLIIVSFIKHRKSTEPDGLKIISIEKKNYNKDMDKGFSNVKNYKSIIINLDKETEKKIDKLIEKKFDFDILDKEQFDIKIDDNKKLPKFDIFKLEGEDKYLNFEQKEDEKPIEEQEKPIEEEQVKEEKPVQGFSKRKDEEPKEEKKPKIVEEYNEEALTKSKPLGSFGDEEETPIVEIGNTEVETDASHQTHEPPKLKVSFYDSSDDDKLGMTDSEEEVIEETKKKDDLNSSKDKPDYSDYSDYLDEESEEESNSDEEEFVEVKPKIIYDKQGNELLKSSVNLIKMTNGKINKENLGYFLYEGRDLTRSAKEIVEYEEKIEKERDPKKKEELIKKRNELFKDYKEKLYKYSNELYKESRKRKKVATIASHKYIMDKLNKLEIK